MIGMKMSSETLLREKTRRAIEDGMIDNYARCFLCNESTGLFFVFWHGCTADIALCEDCALYLGEHLTKDANYLHNMKLVYGVKNEIPK